MKKSLLFVIIVFLLAMVNLLAMSTPSLGKLNLLNRQVEGLNTKDAIKPLPDYSLEGIKPKVYYHEWDSKYSEWYPLDNPSSAKGPVMKVEKFIVDRNKDSVVDLKVLKYYMPEGTYKNKQNMIGIQKAHQWLMVYVDDDLDKLWDRILYDETDASGNPGMDGVFEKEEAVRY